MLPCHWKGYSVEFRDTFNQYLQSFRNSETALPFSLTLPTIADNVHDYRINNM